MVKIFSTGRRKRALQGCNSSRRTRQRGWESRKPICSNCGSAFPFPLPAPLSFAKPRQVKAQNPPSLSSEASKSVPGFHARGKMSLCVSRALMRRVELCSQLNGASALCERTFRRAVSRWCSRTIATHKLQKSPVGLSVRHFTQHASWTNSNLISSPPSSRSSPSACSLASLR